LLKCKISIGRRDDGDEQENQGSPKRQKRDAVAKELKNGVLSYLHSSQNFNLIYALWKLQWNRFDLTTL